MSGLDAEAKLESEILNTSAEVAQRLIINQKATTEIEGLHYQFASRVIQGKYIYLLVACSEKWQIVREKYTPYTVTAEIANEMTLLENMKATIEAFMRHITGAIRPQEVQ